jgi:serine/threonine-protein kinase
MSDDSSKLPGSSASTHLQGDESAEALAATMVLGDGPESSPSDSRESPRQQLATNQTGAHVVDGRYRLVALLGQGGMGNVYKARDLELDEIVALKTLKKELVDNEKAVDRFRAEVRLARRVTHHNVARTFDLGMCGNIPYLTMEFVEGDDLGCVLEHKGRLSVERFMALARPICQALASAHAVGVVHRDLKPQNVIVAKSGRVVLTDFGIARATQRTERLTGEGVPLGTPAYMAPEQVQGDVELDARADIYALGIMFFEMLAGKLPFVGNTPISTALARLVEEAPDLRDYREDVADELVHVIDRCLAKDREERFATVEMLLEALEAAVEGKPVSRETPASTSTPDAQSPSWAREDFLRDFHTSQPVQSPSDFARLDSRPPNATKRDVAKRDATKAVAVLPFRHGGGEDDVYVADGLTEDLIDELSMSQSLKVRPRGAVMRYKQTDLSPREIGDELGVHVIVDGSVRRSGDRLRVRVGLVSVEDGFQIWAKRFKGTSADLFDISEDASRAIVDALTADKLATPQPVAADSSAIDLYLKARHELHASWFGDVNGAVNLFEQALAKTADDPRILSGAALAHARATFYAGRDQDRHFAAALEYANRALDITPERPEPRLALARVHFDRLDYRAALAELRKAIAAAPSNADAHDMLGRLLREIGPLDAALHHLRTALELNPYLTKARWDMVNIYALREEWDEVDRLLALEVDGETKLNVREAARTRTDAWRDDPQWLAEGETRPVTAESPPIRFMCEYRRQAVRTGEVTEAHLAFHREAMAGSVEGSRFRIMVHQLTAESFATVGRYDEAVDQVASAVDAGLLDLMWIEHCPIFGPMRDDPRFEESRRRVAKRVEQILS